MDDQVKKHDVTTTAQVERTYVVEAADEEQAKKRLRAHIADPDSLREGVVVFKDDVNKTAEKINNVVEHTPDEPADEEVESKDA